MSRKKTRGHGTDDSAVASGREIEGIRFMRQIKPIDAESAGATDQGKSSARKVPRYSN